ncbi:hypothetical protein TPHA_0G02540 [Tetrapisispora phaffii CBS 4417]|uniref:Hap4 transcription factor heteromerisation domain-containing protein n=1 Tax=Tetrapisispora phaffii (strain ATCC 24235 / CBS 4417 / NBRC 1672 / NRRL Y-8282 / UCD 70-5) TaxID=1071381 RepID=G8BW11_TETPH|nr:hypothetical protein TPHA_0G02540 [Tetrapisispora phaffii CBS 4417]CCE64089.1 hypothetical protein TPHA_0G02540 [Tetrapisispora phaffii CBS 4417]
MYQQIAIKPSNKLHLSAPQSSLGEYTGLDLATTSIPSSSIIKTSKNWVLPPRPKPGRKTSVAHTRKSVCVANSASANTNKVTKRKDLLHNRQKSNSICSGVIGNAEKTLTRNLDDCTSIFLKFEDEEAIPQTLQTPQQPNNKVTKTSEYTEAELANLISTSLSQSLLQTENELDQENSLLQKDETKLTNEEVSSLLSSSTGSPNSIFSTDHYNISNSTSDLLTLSRFDTEVDLVIDNSNLNFKLLDQNVSPTSDFLPINFTSTFDSEYIPPTLEDIINEQEKSYVDVIGKNKKI